jgi:hypothetical protein
MSVLCKNNPVSTALQASARLPCPGVRPGLDRNNGLVFHWQPFLGKMAYFRLKPDLQSVFCCYTHLATALRQTGVEPATYKMNTGWRHIFQNFEDTTGPF